MGARVVRVLPDEFTNDSGYWLAGGKTSAYAQMYGATNAILWEAHYLGGNRVRMLFDRVPGSASAFRWVDCGELALSDGESIDVEDVEWEGDSSSGNERLVGWVSVEGALRLADAADPQARICGEVVEMKDQGYIRRMLSIADAIE